MAAVEITGTAAVQKMLDQYAPGPEQNLARRAVRAGGHVVQAELKAVAASSDVPRSFTKVPAPKVSTHGGVGQEVYAIVRPKSPLFNIFEPGAGPHEIAPKSGGLLFGQVGQGSWDPAGRKRPDTFAARRPVRHPGMKARPILARAAAAAASAAQEAMAAVILGGPKGNALGTVE